MLWFCDTCLTPKPQLGSQAAVEKVVNDMSVNVVEIKEKITVGLPFLIDAVTAHQWHVANRAKLERQQ